MFSGRDHPDRLWKAVSMRRFTLVGSLVAASAATAGMAVAQTERSALTDQAASTMQMGAASLVPVLKRRWLYSDHGVAVGRVRDVRVSRDGHTLLAIVARRRWLGGGEIAVPVPNLRQSGNELVVSGTPDSIRAMPAL